MSPGIVIPTPRGGLVWIHGEDPSGDPVKVQVNASGLAIVTFDGILDAGERLHGFADTVSQAFGKDPLGAGSDVTNSLIVPAGELWHITQVDIVYVGTAPNTLMVTAIVDAIETRLICQRTPEAAVWYPASVSVYLGPGDYLRARVQGATSGDNLWSRYIGTKQAL